MITKTAIKCLKLGSLYTEVAHVVYRRLSVSGGAGHCLYYHCKRLYSEGADNYEEMKSKIITSLEEEYNKKKLSFERFERDYEQLSVNKFEELIKSEKDRVKIKEILDIYEYEKYMTAFVPKTLTAQQIQRLMNENKGKQTKTLKYFYRLEVEERKRQSKREYIQKMKDALLKLNENFGVEKKVGIHYDVETNSPLYGLWQNSMFPRISDQRFDSRCFSRLYDSYLFGQPLVFDFGFEHEMDEKCLNNTAKQMSFCLGDNRRADNPFSLYFCNVKRNSKSEEKLLKAIGNLYPVPGLMPSFITVNHGSYLDIFPKRKLVYLTPNADRTLHEFDHETIYIVGAFVDRAEQSEKRSSFSKAKREGLKMAKLPIDEYIYIKGQKTLTMDQMMKILVTIKDTNSWNEALQHVPRRKQKTPEEIASEERERLKKLNFKKKPIFSINAMKQQ